MGLLLILKGMWARFGLTYFGATIQIDQADLQYSENKTNGGGRDVLPHPEPGRADGALLWILQQCLAGKTPKGRFG